MTVLRAALLFDHPTTRLFASRILESFFFFASSSSFFSTTSTRSFLRDPSSRCSRVYPRYFSVTVPPLRIPPPFPLPGSCTLVPPQPPSIEVLCKQTHESERRIEGFPCPLVHRLLLLLPLPSLVSHHAADFRKVKRVATMGKAACPLSDGNGIIRPYERYCVAYEIRRIRRLQIRRDIICTSTFNSSAARRKLSYNSYANSTTLQFVKLEFRITK